MGWFLYDNGLRHERVKLGFLGAFIDDSKILRYFVFVGNVRSIFQ